MDLSDKDRAQKVIKIKELLLANEKDQVRAKREYKSAIVQRQTLVELRMEKEQLEHQLEILTGFGQFKADEIVASVRLDDDEEDGGGSSGKKELVKV